MNADKTSRTLLVMVVADSKSGSLFSSLTAGSIAIEAAAVAVAASRQASWKCVSAFSLSEFFSSGTQHAS